jgi:hypothetical protein
VPDVNVVIGVDGKAAVQGIKDVGDAAEKSEGHLSKMGGALGDIAKIAGGIVLAKAFETGTSAIRDAFNAAADYQKMQAATNAVIESTGGKAGVTAKQVTELANAFEKQTAIDDQVIQGAENLLLTFTNIGKDVFPEATKTVLNMSTALGQDAKTSAIQLGKALNDPINGVTALRRVGVSFNETQLETIKRLQESGDIMGAQKIILGELSTEFGGAADAAGKTLGGQLSLLKDTISDTFRDLAVKALPTLVDLTSLLTEGLAKGIDLAGQGLSALGEAVAPLVEPAKQLAGLAFDNLKALYAAEWRILQDVVGWLTDITKLEAPKIFAALDEWVQRNTGQTIADNLRDIANYLGDSSARGRDFSSAWQAINDSLKPALEFLKPLVQDILKSMRDQVRDVSGALKDLGEALKPLQPALEPIAQILGTAIVLAIGALLIQLRLFIDFITINLVVAIESVALTIKGLTKAFEFVSDFVGPWLPTLGARLQDIYHVVDAAVDIIVEPIKNIAQKIGDVSRLLYDVGIAIARSLLDGLVAGAQAVWNEVSSWAGKIKDLKGPMDYDRKLLTPQGYAIALSLDDGLSAGFNEVVKPTVAAMAKEITDTLYDNVPDYVKRLSPAAGGDKHADDHVGGFSTSILNNGQPIYVPNQPKVGDWIGSGTNAQQWDGTKLVQGGIGMANYIPLDYNGFVGADPVQQFNINLHLDGQVIGSAVVKVLDGQMTTEAQQYGVLTG